MKFELGPRVKNIAASKNPPRPFAKNENLISAIICVLLALIVWLAFGNAVQCEFVSYDDGGYVYENPEVTAGLTLQGVGWAFTHFHTANWHPLTTISHMLDCQLYGLQPWGHHLTNVLLQALAAILLFLALRELTSTLQRSTLNFWSCAFVAALFAVHPLRVESVAWVSERKDVLSGVFFMLILLAYAGYARADRPATGRYTLVVVLLALGLMCKPTLVTVPFLLLLLDYWPLGRWQGAGSKERGDKNAKQRSKRHEQVSRVVSTSQQLNASTSDKWSVVSGLIVEKIPLFLLAAASCVVTVFAQKRAMDTDLKLGLIDRVQNALVSYVTYIGQMFYPARLSVLYPYSNIKVGELVFAIGLLTVVSVFVILVRKHYPFLAVGWLWYLGALVPMIGLVQVGLQQRADRYTYLPQIGLNIVIVWGVAALLARWPRMHSAPAVIIGLFAVSLLTLTSRGQTLHWRNSQSLWEQAIQNTSANYIAHDNLGTVFLRDKHPEAAIVEFRKALEIKPDFEDAYVSSGTAFMFLGQIDQAMEFYKKALELRPNSAEDWSNLATAQIKKGELADGIEDYRKAVALKPDSAELQYNLGLALADNHEWPDAIKCYQAAIRSDPNKAKFHNSLGVALIKIGQADDALQELREALRVNPNYPEAHYNFGAVLAYLGRKEEAAAQFEDALRLKPNYVEARQQLQQLGGPVSP